MKEAEKPDPNFIFCNFVIKKRIERNKNAIITINGPTGSGKTYAGLSFCENMSKIMGTVFNENNIDFNFKELLKKMMLPENQAPGTCFLFEEVGAVGGGASAMEWQSQINRFFTSFLQTNRCKNQILVFTSPLFSNLSKGARELCHYQWSMLNINPQTKRSTVKPFSISINERSGKMYMKYSRFKMNGKNYKINKLYFKLPSSHLIDKYEQMKADYIEKHNRAILEEPKKDIGGSKRKVDPEKLKEYVKQGLSQREISLKFDCNLKTVSDWVFKLGLNKKSIDIPKENAPSEDVGTV